MILQEGLGLGGQYITNSVVWILVTQYNDIHSIVQPNRHLVSLSLHWGWMRERSICYDQGYVDIVIVIAVYEVVIILLVLRLL